MSACSSYRPGKLMCRDGFPQFSAYCRGVGYTCRSCGHPSERLPLCLGEIAPPHLFDDAGLPCLAEYRVSAHPRSPDEGER